MDYPRNDELLSAYLDRELSPDERAAIVMHRVGRQVREQALPIAGEYATHDASERAPRRVGERRRHVV